MSASLIFHFSSILRVNFSYLFMQWSSGRFLVIQLEGRGFKSDPNHCIVTFTCCSLQIVYEEGNVKPPQSSHRRVAKCLNVPLHAIEQRMHHLSSIHCNSLTFERMQKSTAPLAYYYYSVKFVSMTSAKIKACQNQSI